MAIGRDGVESAVRFLLSRFVVSSQEPSPHSPFRYPTDFVHEFVLFLNAFLVVPNDAVIRFAVRINSQRVGWNEKRDRMFVRRRHGQLESNPVSNLLDFGCVGTRWHRGILRPPLRCPFRPLVGVRPGRVNFARNVAVMRVPLDPVPAEPVPETRIAFRPLAVHRPPRNRGPYASGDQ